MSEKVQLTAEQIEKLEALAKQQRANLEKMGEEFKAENDKYLVHIYTCNATGCNSGGAQGVLDACIYSIKTYGLEDKVRIIATGCMGLCGLGPLMRVEAKGKKPFMYKLVDAMLARLIIAEHVVPLIKAIESGTVDDFEVQGFLKEEHELSLEIPFFTKQKKVVLGKLGHSDPDNFAEYIAMGGYKALDKALSMSPHEVVEEIKKSGLRGRGGAGFSTGTKWEIAARNTGEEKFVICNGDEGDPGAYMDSCILGGGPHLVLEGMMIAAYAIGATSGWFYIRAEYPLAVHRIEQAIKQAKKAGLLGKNILGKGFDFMADVRLGAGAFVCGEETALIASVEGKRGTPTPRPPYPAQKGLWGYPSCINNVETLANVPIIIEQGADVWGATGIGTSKGTKVFALTGSVANVGLVEVPMGVTVREMVEEIGGGTSSGLPFKGLQTGGPSGGILPASEMDAQIGYDELRKMGSMMGSGGMIVIDDSDSMIDIAKFYLGFTVEESCGKCAPCRIGGYQMLQLLKKIADGIGTIEDLKKIRKISTAMKKASLCGLGQTASNPVDSTVKYFRQEYLDKIKENTRAIIAKHKA